MQYDISDVNYQQKIDDPEFQKQLKAAYDEYRSYLQISCMLKVRPKSMEAISTMIVDCVEPPVIKYSLLLMPTALIYIFVTIELSGSAERISVYLMRCWLTVSMKF